MFDEGLSHYGRIMQRILGFVQAVVIKVNMCSLNRQQRPRTIVRSWLHF